jgi:hypothetical protein
MLTKLLSVVGFLVALGVTFWLVKAQQERTLRKIRSRNTGIVSYAFAMAFLLLTFVQFWCLTRIFPIYVVLLFMAASLVGVMLHNLIGAIAGFGHAQKNEKINVMNLILGAQHKATGCVMIIGGVIVIISIGVTLHKFWTVPIGSAEVLAWSACSLFIFPQLLSAISTLMLIVPVLTSEYVDNDVRNSALSTQFSSIIYSTIALIFPVWILKQEKAQIFKWMPPEWVLLSIPLSIFLLGCLVPFFIGMHRYRSQRRAQLDWRKEWLISTEELLAGAAPITEKMEELQNEITSRAQSNELRAFIEKFPSTVATLTDASPGSAAAKAAEGILNVINANVGKLNDWDIRFREEHKLSHLSQTMSQMGAQNAGGFVGATLKHTNEEIDNLSKQRNIFASGFWGFISAMGPLVFKAYQDKIMALIGALTHLSH